MKSRQGLRAGLALVALLAGSSLADAWGFRAHRMATRRAVATLPPEMEMFRANAEYLAQHSIDPDLWREQDEAEGPNHFVDFEDLGDDAFVFSRDEAEHLRRHGPDARESGVLPWRLGQVYGQLVAAFRAGDHGRALERAATLAHYVGDAHVPLHASSNHDGQHTGQQGIHGRWESRLFDRFETQIEEAAQPSRARRIADPVAAIFEVMVASNAASYELLASDRLAAAGAVDFAETPADERYDDAYYSRLWQHEQSRMIARYAATASLTGALWYSAWEDAGRPALDPAFRIAYVRGARRAVIVSLDGAGAAAIDDAVARGVMPVFGAIRAAGATPEGSLGSLPVKTAPAHAALFTGTWSDVNGVAGNEVPVPEGTVLQSMDGFDSRRLATEPLWVSAARQGLSVTVAQATHIWPLSPYERGGRFGDARSRLNLLDGYGAVRQGPSVHTQRDLELRPLVPGATLPAVTGAPRAFALNVLGVRVEGLVYDDPADPTEGFDTVRLAESRDFTKGIVLKPAAAGAADAFAGLDLRADGAVTTAFFRLYELAPDLSHVLLFRSSLHVLQANRPDLQRAAHAATGGFVGGGARDVYDRGALGPTLWQGGDGTAERRYVETIALCLRQLARLAEFAGRHTRWDVLVTYAPFPDEAMHTWLGRLDPALATHDPAVAARLRPFLDDVLRLIDAYLGRVAALAGEDDVLAVISDHGHVGVDRAVRPNVALRRAGLLTLGGDGQVDLARTRAVYFPGNAAHVQVNTVGRPGGIVAPGDEAAVRADVRQALLAVTDPKTGVSPVVDVFDPRVRCATPVEVPHCPGAGRPTGGDLYLSLRPGYTLSPTLSGNAVEDAPPRGEHFTDPDRRVLQAAVTFRGLGVRQGRVGLIRHVDVAPTVLALLGAEPGPLASGRVLGDVLASPAAPWHLERTLPR